MINLFKNKRFFNKNQFESEELEEFYKSEIQTPKFGWLYLFYSILFYLFFTMCFFYSRKISSNFDVYFGLLLIMWYPFFITIPTAYYKKFNYKILFNLLMFFIIIFYMLIGQKDKFIALLQMFIFFSPSIIAFIFVEKKEDSNRRNLFLNKQTIIQQRQQLEEALIKRKEFLRNANHNLRQPIQCINNYTHLLKTKCDKEEFSALPELIEDLSNATDFLNYSVEKIFKLSKLDDDNYAIKIADVDLNIVLKHLKSYEISNSHLQIYIEDKLLPYYVLSNEDCLFESLSNLLDNAIKYTPSGTVSLTVELIENTVQVHIMDTGIGIAKEQQEKIFEPFYRINESDNSHGIGLAIVKRTAERLPNHHIKLITSEMGKGSHFCFSMPLSHNKIAETIITTTMSATELDKPILLIEDNAEVIKTMSAMLQTADYDIITAMSVREAKEQINNEFGNFSLIISDYILGNQQTAKDIIEYLQTDYNDIPVLIITGDPVENNSLEFFGHHYPVLKKPFTLDALLKKINALL